MDGEVATLLQAIKRKAFARAFKKPVPTEPALPDEVDALLQRDALQALALANKAGRVVCGSAKVESALAGGDVIALLRARSASPDGCRKIDAAAPAFRCGRCRTARPCTNVRISPIGFGIGARKRDTMLRYSSVA